jgi:hypothetical protein
MGARGCALDNAVCEAFFASLKKEKLNRRAWPTNQAARNAVFAWIEGWYNRRRLHSTLGYLSPADYENRTLIDGGTSLAASRLAPTSEMIRRRLRRPAPTCPPKRVRSKPRDAAGCVVLLGFVLSKRGRLVCARSQPTEGESSQTPQSGALSPAGTRVSVPVEIAPAAG